MRSTTRRVAGLEPLPEAWALNRKLLELLEEAWRQPDEGIWEVRGPRRHFTHSKVMAWVAFDRAVRSAEEFGREGPVDRWRRFATRSTRRSAARASTRSSARSPSPTARSGSTPARC